MTTNICYKWESSDFKWSDGNWTWSECELVREICAKWGEENVWWKNENIWWSKCHTSKNICPIWGTENVKWKNENIWWSKCVNFIPPEPPEPPTPSISVFVQPSGVDATTLIQPWLIEPWNPYKVEEDKRKRKRLIKLICKIKGKTYEEEKTIGESNISINDIKMVVNKISGIDLDIKLKE